MYVGKLDNLITLLQSAREQLGNVDVHNIKDKYAGVVEVGGRQRLVLMPGDWDK